MHKIGYKMLLQTQEQAAYQAKHLSSLSAFSFTRLFISQACLKFQVYFCICTPTETHTHTHTIYMPTRTLIANARHAYAKNNAEIFIHTARDMANLQTMQMSSVLCCVWIYGCAILCIIQQTALATLTHMSCN